VLEIDPISAEYGLKNDKGQVMNFVYWRSKCSLSVSIIGSKRFVPPQEIRVMVLEIMGISDDMCSIHDSRQVVKFVYFCST